MQGSDIEKFKEVLVITQLLQKYNIPIENIEFTEEEQLFLVAGDISILMGEDSDMEEKIAEAMYIYEYLQANRDNLDTIKAVK